MSNPVLPLGQVCRVASKQERSKERLVPEKKR